MNSGNRQRKDFVYLVLTILFFLCLFVDHHAVAQESVTQSTTGDQSPAINTQGNVRIDYGLSEKDIKKMLGEFGNKLKKELNLSEKALESFFKILQEKQVPPEQLENRLREIAKHYKELLKKLEGFQSDDAVVADLKGKAREALEHGDFDAAEAFLNDACKRDLELIRQEDEMIQQLQEARNKRLLSAAASKAENGDLKNTRLDYKGAAAYYKEAAELVPPENELVLAEYLIRWAKAYYDTGKYAEAEAPLKRALEIRERLIKAENDEIGSCLNNLALLYDAQGKYKKAEPLYKRSLAIKEKVLGSEHPELAITLNNLAELYRYQGRYEEAEPLYKRSLAIKKKVLGPEHLEFAITFGNIGKLYQSQGRYEGSEIFYKQALDIFEKKLGTIHPHVSVCLNDLAGLYSSQGRYEEAEPLYRRSLAITEKVLGLEHPSLAITLSNLAGLYKSQSRYEEAEPLYRRSLAITEKVLGLEHPSLAATLNNLAGLYRTQGQYDKAEPLYKRSLAIKEKVLGPEHPELAFTLSNLAGLYESQGRYEEAEPLYKRSLKIAEKALGKDHPKVKQIKENIKNFYLSRVSNAVRIKGIVDGGQAQKLNLQKDDLIIAYNNTKTPKPQTLIRQTNKTAPDAAVTMCIIRQQKLIKISLKGGKMGIQIEPATIPQEELETYYAEAGLPPAKK